MTEAAAFAPAHSRHADRGELWGVLDTNVPIAAYLSRSPASPTVELLERWRGGQFAQLYSDLRFGIEASAGSSGPRA